MITAAFAASLESQQATQYSNLVGAYMAGTTCKNLFCEQSGMPVTAVAGGAWTSENAGVLSREYVIALSTAQITNTNSTA